MSVAGKKEAKTSPEVSEKATRRRFTVAFKEQILAEADQCTDSGEIGELLRREGLYSSSLARSRREQTRCGLDLSPLGMMEYALANCWPNWKKAEPMNRLEQVSVVSFRSSLPMLIATIYWIWRSSHSTIESQTSSMQAT